MKKLASLLMDLRLTDLCPPMVINNILTEVSNIYSITYLSTNHDTSVACFAQTVYPYVLHYTLQFAALMQQLTALTDLTCFFILR